MKNVMLIVSYQTNYNGCCVHTRSDVDSLDGLDCDDVRNQDQVFGDKMEQLEEAVVNEGDKDFDGEEECWNGSNAAMHKFVTAKVTELFGEDQPFELEFDNEST